MEQLLVNKEDRRRLLSFIEAERTSWLGYRPLLDWLTQLLDHAQLCEPGEVPADLVTMNSQVEVKPLRRGPSRLLTLVYPGEQNIAEGKVSVFNPIGLQLLGSRTGDLIAWNGTGAARIDSLRYQPEAAGEL